MIIKTIKKYIKKFPYILSGLYKLVIIKNQTYKFIKLIGKDNEKIFTNFYLKNKWRNNESLSGDGSTVEATTETRKIIKRVLSKYRIKSFLDIPCGDFNWMRLIDFQKCKYYGSDIVQEIIKENKNYEKKNLEFFKCNILNDNIQRYDLIFCRDCFVHLSNKDIMKAIKNIIKSKSKYLLTTTFPFQKKKQMDN